MPTVGILLAGSTLYPAIGIDFLEGLKSCFRFQQLEDIRLPVSVIGYGLKEEDIYKQAEKLLLSDEADVVVVCADERHAQTLSPLFAAMGKLLVITNIGANYPPSSAGMEHTLFHSLNESLCSFLTGQLCARESVGKQAILATSYYDAGYQHCHAMSNAFALQGGEIEFNFVSHFKKEEFNVGPLIDFIKKNETVKDLLCLYTGDLARFFYRDMMAVQQQTGLRLYGSPMMFDSSPGDFAETKPCMPPVKGYTAWLPEIDNDQNKEFIRQYRQDTGKEPSLFSVQGWETGLLLAGYLACHAKKMTTPAALAEMKARTWPAPRGVLHIHHSNAVLGPAYLTSACGKMETRIEDSIEDTRSILDEIQQQVSETGANWRNTYLCI